MLLDVLINNLSFSSVIGVLSFSLYYIIPLQNISLWFGVHGILLVLPTSDMERETYTLYDKKIPHPKKRFPFISVIILLIMSFFWYKEGPKGFLYFSIFQLIWTIGVYIVWRLTYKKYYIKNIKAKKISQKNKTKKISQKNKTKK